MSSIPLDIRRQAKELIEAGKSSQEIGSLLDIKPGTVREWKRRYMWDGPDGSDRQRSDDLDDNQLPAEYERIMSTDVMETLHWIRRMPMSRRIDSILKRERALEMLSKRAERVIGGLARSHGQQSKVIHVNSVTAILSSHESSGCGVT
jgi:transposase